MLNLIDEVIGSTSLYEFQRRIEITLAKIFDADRVNCVLVHRYKRFLYRIVKDSEGVQSLKMFDLTLGLAGFVTVAGHGILSEHIASDGRFMKEIDDPNGDPNKPPL